MDADKNNHKARPLEACSFYIELGMPVIPCCPSDHAGMSPRHKNECKSPGKAPLIKGWTIRTKTTTSELDMWIKQWPYANPGLPLGSASGLIGVDIDGETGERLLKEMSNGDVPPTWEFSTGAGRRLIYGIPEGVILKKFSQADRAAEHQEIALLGEGQQTVIPPAIHWSGREYRWSNGRDPITFGPVTLAPSWIIDKMMVKKVVPIMDAKRKNFPKTTTQENPEEDSKKLSDKCPKFAEAWAQQKKSGIDEESWFLLVGFLVSAGYPTAAEVFSKASKKHNQRSEERLKKLIERQSEDPLPPVRCTTFGCTAQQILTCHGKIRVNRENEITNSPAAFIMTPWQATRRYFIGSKFISKRLGDHIIEDFYFCFAGQVLYVYRSGVYIESGMELIRSECKERLGDEFRKDRVNETVYYIETASMCDPTELNNRPEVLNVMNGLLRWEIKKELLPHDPSYLSTIQLPVRYDPAATCPNTEKFWKDVLPLDCIPTIEELYGYVIVPSTKLQKAFMFTGSGSNGKGTLIDQVTAVVGRRNVSNVPLQDLSDHRFKRAELFGKLLNIFADLDKRALESTSYFKMVVSGDEIDAERKHKDPFFFRPFARLIFSANELPRASDHTYAYFRRWIIIPFEKRFVIGDNADTTILRKITTDQELSGVLNRALEGLRRLNKTGDFTQSKVMVDALESYQLANDSVAGFVKEQCIITNDVTTMFKVGKVDLYNAYKKFCTECNLRSVSARRFYSRIFELVPVVRETRPTGGLRLLYGIGLVENDNGFTDEFTDNG